MMLIRALHAAFGEAEKPEASPYDFCSCGHQMQHHGEHACGAYECQCDGFTEPLKEEPKAQPKRGLKQAVAELHAIPVPDRCTSHYYYSPCELEAGHAGWHKAGRAQWENACSGEQGRLKPANFLERTLK
jgi:hypothetical protein